MANNLAESVGIPRALNRKLGTRSTCIPFFIRSPGHLSLKPRSWRWADVRFVRLPLSQEYASPPYPSPMWPIITHRLVQLQASCANAQSDARANLWFRNTIELYNSAAATGGDFKLIQDDRRLVKELLLNIPGVVDHALALGQRLKDPIPILQPGVSRTLYLTRKLVCSLLANAFLCTMPTQDGRNVPDFAFDRLYSEMGKPHANQLKREKVKCLLKYFAAMCGDPVVHPNSIISYERRCIRKQYDWLASRAPLTTVTVVSGARIEDDVGMLQVDFANKNVGGGVLTTGAVQEEILFMVRPELIVARLFTAPLTDNEVLVVTGTAQYASSTGYSDSFKCADAPIPETPVVDYLGRAKTRVVAMDALRFATRGDHSQYSTANFRRELHKCYVAFRCGSQNISVSTGLWGCGIFNGDPEFKFLIQWMAAAVRRRPVRFHAPSTTAKRFKEQVQLLVRRNVTVGQLYQLLCGYKVTRQRNGTPQLSVFDFVAQRV